MMAENPQSTAAGSRSESRPTSPGVVVVKSFDNYPAAQSAVDSLADRGYPVERLYVVARDLVLVEQVTGHRTAWRAAAEGAWTGAFVGAVLGFFFGLFEWIEPLVSAMLLALWGVVLGGIIGAAVGGTGHWALGGRRDFSSMTSMEAGRYDLMADEDTAAEVQSMLSR